MDRGPNAISNTPPSARESGAATGNGSGLPGQVVLVLQGGGALGAYQVGVYEALHEAGIEPDWVIGTSIGAINAALIAGNAPRAPARAPAVRSGPASSSAPAPAARADCRAWAMRSPTSAP